MTRLASLSLLLAVGLGTQVYGQNLPPNLPSKEQLANDNNLFVTLAKKALHWEEPADPARIVGPIYFVGTKGLGAFLITTSEGHILMNTGMPTSGPMIVNSIRKLGFKPEDIKLMINGHAHTDHAGAFGFMKEKYGAQLAVMKDDVAAMESGDMNDFKYANDLTYPGVKVDRILRDGDQIKMGDVLLTAYHTPGHTRGATTWVTNIVVDGKAYVVVFPDGAGFNHRRWCNHRAIGGLRFLRRRKTSRTAGPRRCRLGAVRIARHRATPGCSHCAPRRFERRLRRHGRRHADRGSVATATRGRANQAGGGVVATAEATDPDRERAACRDQCRLRAALRVPRR